MLDLSQNLVHLRWLLKLVNFRAVGKLRSYIRIPIALEDIRLLLDQRSEALFPWYLRCSMKSTKSTYNDRIRIGQSSYWIISKCGKIGMIIYLPANRSLF
ncbi:hypothetical protein Golax_015215 [Gossypium laxum]|uniref:Uncharacterized protein n=1 Tax=Gossypium laxum TaxID=34288 RepID=A0A7J8ZX56_9ROSI|nr:hypothetical protein [Gossypium laxum]